MLDKDISKVYSILEKEVQNYKVPVVDLIKIQTNDPFKVLIATILSARTKDETTVNACKKLFKAVNKVDDFNSISIKQIEKLIYPVGFYHTKAKHLKLLPKVLKEKFNGVIPETVEELIQLPGVGRKTANLVVAIGFNKPGMCVDVHVHRISNRFGYIKTKTPFESEMALRKKLPLKYWEKYNSVLVAFGQNLCRPINPRCWECPVSRYCDYYRKIYSKKNKQFK
ncbi:MAG: endonuclease III domain-containing protein [Candidatus Woesearchaeota archaeon]